MQGTSSSGSHDDRPPICGMSVPEVVQDMGGACNVQDGRDTDAEKYQKSRITGLFRFLAIAITACACFTVGSRWGKQQRPATAAQQFRPRGGRRLAVGSTDHPGEVQPLTHRPELQGLRILAENAYSATAPAHHPLWRIIEPHRPTTLTVEDACVSEDEARQISYAWSLAGGDGAAHAPLGAGRSVSHDFAGVGQVLLTVTASACPSCADAHAWSARAYTEFFAIRYVRREIRVLNDEDRERFLTAAETLYRVPRAEGVLRFGADYLDNEHFVGRHLRFGGRRECDHWHEGPGFVTSHIAFTLEWEKALQKVDPAVSVPYWDYTLESTFYTPETWRTSKVFDPMWFGPADPGAGDADTPNVLSKGRWAYVPVRRLGHAGFREPTGDNDIDDPDTTPRNAWGLMRAPWNLDPTPFATRSAAVLGWINNLKPRGCDAFDKCLKMDNWMDLAMCLNTDAHGYVHELMGGSWGQRRGDMTASEVLLVAEQVSEGLFEFLHSAQALSKMLWRNDYVTCPSVCDLDVPPESCRCTCDAAVFADLGTYEVFRRAGVLAALHSYDTNGVRWEPLEGAGVADAYVLIHRSREETEAVLEKVGTLLCDMGYLGDMYTGTSPNDITFWVLHPSLDRLWHRQRLSAIGTPAWANGGPVVNTGDSAAAGRAAVAGVGVGAAIGATAARKGQEEADKGPGSGSTAAARAAAATGEDRPAVPSGWESELQPYDETWEPTHSCWGHNPDDITPFDSGLFLGVTPGRKLTNKELYRLLDPTGPHLTYVFDNYRWTHCETLGWVTR